MKSNEIIIILIKNLLSYLQFVAQFFFYILVDINIFKNTDIYRLKSK